MASNRAVAFADHFRTIFVLGAASNSADGQLLEQFTSRVGEASELAFAALVDRHGPMVLRACRDILEDDHEAQDAFQATFLILARKAGSLWIRDSVGPWLHRVACRVAVRARTDAGRRRAVERRAAQATTRATAGSPPDGEWAGLHEEIDRLPACYRGPIVLCYLEGLPYEQVSLRLGCPVGTIKSRLARGRAILKRRLGRDDRPGFSPRTSEGVRRASVPAALAMRTVRFAIGATPAVSRPVKTLIEGGMRAMFVTKCKATAMILMAVAAISAGATVLGQQGLGGRGPETREKAAPGSTTPRASDGSSTFVPAGRTSVEGGSEAAAVAALERRLKALEERLAGTGPEPPRIVGARQPGEPYQELRERIEGEGRKAHIWDVLVLGGFVGQYDLADASPREVVLGLYRVYYGIAPKPEEVDWMVGKLGEDRDRVAAPERIVRRLLDDREFLSTPLVEAILRNPRTRRVLGTQ